MKIKNKIRHENTYINVESVIKYIFKSAIQCSNVYTIMDIPVLILNSFLLQENKMVLVTLLTSPALGLTPEEAEMPTENPILSDEECLKERKWWCFLLSSIFTFLMGVLSVVVVRGITSICCHKDEDEFSQVSFFFNPEFCFLV